MKVILLQDVSGLGKRLEVKTVSDGHALNMLIPRGLAREATPGALKQAETERARLEAEHAIHADLLEKNLGSVEGKTIHITAKANEQGHLFASIHKEAIIQQLKDELRVEVRPDFLELPEHIKTVGEHTLTIAVKGKKAGFTLVVEAAK